MVSGDNPVEELTGLWAHASEKMRKLIQDKLRYLARQVKGEIVPDPALSVEEIRRILETVGHSYLSTVALIGGGHSVGNYHGACPVRAGNAPNTVSAEGTEI